MTDRPIPTKGTVKPGRLPLPEVHERVSTEQAPEPPRDGGRPLLYDPDGVMRGEPHGHDQ